MHSDKKQVTGIILLALLAIVAGSTFSAHARARATGVWNDPNIVNFLIAWIPFALSILMAFIPDSRLSMKTRVAWRGSVIGCGLAYSVLLWHQQALTQKIGFQDQQRMLTDAI